MKQLIYLALLLCVMQSCSPHSQSEYEKVITAMLETNDSGVRTDYQVKYSKLEVSPITIADSIAILKEQFESEKANKIESIEKTIKLKE